MSKKKRKKNRANVVNTVLFINTKMFQPDIRENITDNKTHSCNELPPPPMDLWEFVGYANYLIAIVKEQFNEGFEGFGKNLAEILSNNLSIEVDMIQWVKGNYNNPESESFFDCIYPMLEDIVYYAGIEVFSNRDEILYFFPHQ